LSASLADSFTKCLAAINILEGNGVYLNQNPKCEPRLGKRGIYSPTGGRSDIGELPLLWVLNLSDGSRTLLEIAERSGLPFQTVKAAANLLEEHNLIRESRQQKVAGRPVATT
jgi:aminopeptidase-like protein